MPRQKLLGFTGTAYIQAAAAVAASLLACAAQGQISACGDMSNQFGPLDYRTASDADRIIVERRHFTPNVESLTKGETSSLGGDLSYTLKVFPNHVRALSSMARLARREKRSMPTGSDYSIDCWFERAIRFQPGDPAVRIMMGIELLRDDKFDAAIEQLKIGEELTPESANVHYNLGLAYFDKADFDQSLRHAKRAYELGFPLPGLRDKLQRAGKWHH